VSVTRVVPGAAAAAHNRTVDRNLDDVRHLTAAELEAGLAHVMGSPKDAGRLDLIVRRPAVGEREVLEAGTLNRLDGLVGDSWRLRPGTTGDGSPDPDAQLNVMNARCVRLVAGGEHRRPLAGDQLYLDLDLSVQNLPVGTRLAIGEAVIEITAKPHRGCQKFADRFGLEALRFVNSATGRALRLRGLNARVVRDGTIRRGDSVTVC